MGLSANRLPDTEAYFPAVRRAAQFIRDERLHELTIQLSPSLDGRIPFARIGRFGAVFKFEGSNQDFALKVFLGNEPKRGLRYNLIHEHLKQTSPTSRLISFNYDEQGILVKGQRYPTLVMDWSFGISLDRHITDQLAKQQLDNIRLCKEWARTMGELRSRKIAHGDLQHENVLVCKSGTFQLVDYDGMFVPSMRAHRLQAPEGGRPAYQHPQRSAEPPRTNYFNERLDDFSALVILLNLAAVDARLWAEYHRDDDDRLLISEGDLREPTESALLKALSEGSGPVARLTQLLVDAASGDLEVVPSFETVIADPDVQPLFEGPRAVRTATRVPPGLLPSSVGARSSSARAAEVRKPAAHTPTAPVMPRRPRKRAAVAAELTPREREIARLLASGLSVPQIAQKLKLAQSTVVRYLNTLRTKTGSGSPQLLTAWAKAQFPPPPISKTSKTRSPQTRKPPRKRTTTISSGPVAEPAARRPAEELPARKPPEAVPRQLQPVAAKSPEQVPDLATLFRNQLPQPEAIGRGSRLGRQGAHRPSSLDRLGLQNPPAKQLTAEGEAHLEANRNDQALAAFDQALAKDANYVPALVGRGEARRRVRRFDEALGDLNRALQLRPGDARALEVRGNTNRDSGRKFRAFADRLRANWRGPPKA